MSVNRILVKNFTVFKDIEINLSSSVNIFIGENGTGKTHILKLIYGTKLDDGNGQIKMFPESEYIRFFDQTSNNVQNLSFDKIILEHDYDDNYIFIPAKEMLSMSKILKINDKYKSSLNMDKTLSNIIEKSLTLKPDNIPEMAKKFIPVLEKYLDGKVFVEDDDTFWVLKNNGTKIPFTMEAEGIRKIGLLWQLLMNENIISKTILLWDEPESNLNPKLIPDLVEILLELSRNGVQIFIATHDYILAKYFEIRRKPTDSVMFHSLYKENNFVQCESNINFRDLKNNSIISSFDELLDEVYFKNMGD